MEGTEKFGPCLQKDCHNCCDPVLTRSQIPNEKIPKGNDGQENWKKKDEIWIPQDEETTRLQPFECVNLDLQTGLCRDYENRPAVCRATSCVQDRTGNVDKQHEESIKQRFFKIPKKKV